MNNLDQDTDKFIETILSTEEYKNYVQELEKVKQYPELKAQIDDYRKRNYEFQMNMDSDFGRLNMFGKEYEDFRDSPLVGDFLAAELGLCRMVQDIYMRIVEALQFE